VSDDERRRWSMAAVGVLVTWSLTLIGAVWAASADRASIADRLEANSHRITDHEQRLRVLEQQLTQVSADVKWIRQTLERQMTGSN